jgi:hypothetical protein
VKTGQCDPPAAVNSALSHQCRSERRPRLIRSLWSCVALLTVATAAGAAEPLAYDQAPINWELYEKRWLKDLTPASENEPLLKHYSEAKAREFLDDTALKWARQNRCGTCHTTISYLMARPLIGGTGDHAAWDEVAKRSKPSPPTAFQTNLCLQPSSPVPRRQGLRSATEKAVVSCSPTHVHCSTICRHPKRATALGRYVKRACCPFSNGIGAT